VRSFVRKRLYSICIVSGIIVSLLDGFISSLTKSEIYGLLKGIKRPARPFQRLDHIEGKIVVGVGVAAAEIGLDR